MANKFTVDPKLKKLIGKIILYCFLAITGIVLLLVLMVRIGIFGKLPTEIDIKQAKNNMATEIITVDNQLLGRYYYDNRTNSEFKNIPKELINALIATEDARFYKHNGIDYRSSMRVFVKSILFFNKNSGGGSTISQQLAKNLYPRRRFSFLTMPVAKIKEIFIAKRLEKIYTKNEILELYLNTVSFGENTYGIETASIIFFNKKPIDLKIEESTLLIGLLKANNSYNPRTNSEAAKNRRNLVLHQMVRYGYLKKDEADSLKDIPIHLKYRRLTHNEGPAPYFREQLRHEATEILADKKKADGSSYNLYADGLKIYTTINYQMQIYAEEAVKEHLTMLQKAFDKHWKGKEPWKKDPTIALSQIKQSARYQSLIDRGFTQEQAIEEMKTPCESSVFNWESTRDTIISPLDSILYHFKILQTGMLVMNGQNGDVMAWIGGANYKFFKYDHVKSKRQVGSTFKPIVYAAALEAGISPCDFFANDSVVYESYDKWTPQNADRDYGGYYSMKGALVHSINTVSAKIIMQTGIGKTIALAHKMGIKSDLPEVPSLALGTGEMSLYELVQAYCVFLNKGKPVTPRIIRRIEDSKGHVIYSDPAHTLGDSVMSAETAQTMLAMMQGTVNRGTASSLRGKWNLSNAMAGKTGTTQNQTDSWFMGLIPNLVVGVWVGGDNPAVRFRSINFGQGSYSALPIYAKFLTKLYEDPIYKYMKSATFKIPQEIYNRDECDDFSENEIAKPLDFLKLKDTSVGEFIKRIFGRNKRNNTDDTLNN